MKYKHTLIVNEKEINILVKAFEMYENHVDTIIKRNANKESLNQHAESTDQTKADVIASNVTEYAKFWQGRELGYQAKVKSMHKVFKAMAIARAKSEFASISEASEFEES